MNFSISELNELIYSVGIAKFKGDLVNKEINNRLETKLRDELDRKNKELEEIIERDKIRYDLNFKRNFIKYGDY